MFITIISTMNIPINITYYDYDDYYYLLPKTQRRKAREKALFHRNAGAVRDLRGLAASEVAAATLLVQGLGLLRP